MSRDDSRLVYSSAAGRVCPHCGLGQKRCLCRKNPRGAGREAPTHDGIVRVQREKKGRKGKTVTTITGIPLPSDELRDLAGDLKRSCGSGGSLKDSVIEIQGDHRDALVAALAARGYTVKRAGG
ncbi:MAG: translation initiation factor Sui1 [Deltaproteobacteria bacterium]|nr:translation initiation factor Sui1 [Deltaproteobacteria bacterium]MBW2362284.1 translation initiation factor Sui1 [Deltaproteobacteria bacterium]